MGMCALLAATRLFSSLETATIRRLVDRCTMRAYPAGATLFVAGDPGDQMFVVARGSVKVVVTSEDGEITLATFGQGDVFGELALFTAGGQRTATAVTVDPSDLLVIDRHTFDTVLRSSPRFLHELLCEVATRLRRTNQLLSPAPEVASYDRVGGPGGGAVGHDVTLVGYGRYGNLHIGPKYASRSDLWNVSAIVDPLLTRSQYRVSRLGLARP